MGVNSRTGSVVSASIGLAVAAPRFAYRLADAECPAGSLTMRALDGFRNARRGRGTGQVDGVGYG